MSRMSRKTNRITRAALALLPIISAFFIWALYRNDPSLADPVSKARFALGAAVLALASSTLVGLAYYGPRRVLERIADGLRRNDLRVRLTITALSALVCLIAIESCLLVVNQFGSPRTRQETAERFVEPDGELGYRLKANFQTQVRKFATADGRQLYEATYTTDAFGRRSTPSSEPGRARRAVLFFGGSFTFGEGLNDEQTIPALFAQQAPHYLALN